MSKSSFYCLINLSWLNFTIKSLQYSSSSSWSSIICYSSSFFGSCCLTGDILVLAAYVRWVIDLRTEAIDWLSNWHYCQLVILPLAIHSAVHLPAHFLLICFHVGNETSLIRVLNQRSVFEGRRRCISEHLVAFSLFLGLHTSTN